MNKPKMTTHRVTMPDDMALEYLDKLLVVVNKQFLDHGFPIALSMAIDKMRTPLPDNKALTVEELREMDGKSVWVKNRTYPEDDGFYLVNLEYEQYFGRPDCVSEVLMSKSGCFFMMNNVGKGLMAYRRPPEKGD